MIFAVNVPQSKTVSIAFISIKTMIFGLIATTSAQKINSNLIQESKQNCNQYLFSFVSVLSMFFVLGLIIDLIAIAYFFCQTQFKKIEYFIFYVFHIVIGLLVIVGGITNLHSSSGCGVLEALMVSLVASSILFQINALIAMNGHLFFILKYLHFGSNLVWTIIWLTAINCQSIIIALIALIHGIFSVINMGGLIAIKCMGKTSGVVKFWKLLTLISIFMMVLCLAFVIFGMIEESSCSDIAFFEMTYQRFGVLQILSPLLVFIFVRGEKGDLRDQKIKNYQEAFAKLEQNDNVDFSSKI